MLFGVGSLNANGSNGSHGASGPNGPTSPGGLGPGAVYGGGGGGGGGAAARAPLGSAELETVYELGHMIESFKEGITDSSSGASGAQTKHAYLLHPISPTLPCGGG